MRERRAAPDLVFPEEFLAARLTEIGRQELRVDVGNVQQRNVAEGRDPIQLVGRLRLARSRPQACSRRGGEGEKLEKFAALQLPVYGRRGIEQQSDEVLDLLGGERA